MKIRTSKKSLKAFRVPVAVSEQFAEACAAKYESMTAVVIRLMRDYALAVSEETIKNASKQSKLEQYKKLQRPKTSIEAVFEAMDVSKIPQSVQDWLSNYDDSHGNMHKLVDDLNNDVEFSIDHSEDQIAFMALIVEAGKK